MTTARWLFLTMVLTALSSFSSVVAAPRRLIKAVTPAEIAAHEQEWDACTERAFRSCGGLKGDEKGSFQMMAGQAIDYYGHNPQSPAASATLKAVQACIDRTCPFVPLGSVAPAAPQTDQRLPIIFLPGVAGTELRDAAGTGNQIWPLVATIGIEFGGNRFKMLIDRDGIGNADRVKYGDVLRSPPTNFYGGLIAFLTKKGYKEGSDLLVMPYDWRISPDSADHFDRLDHLISEALQHSGAKKVILLAHSLGGVVARAYLVARPRSAAKVDSLISMGTPYWGSVKPFYALVDGYGFGNPDVTDKTMKILARNFAAAYQLLPQLPFISDTDGRQMTVDESFEVQYRGYEKGPGGIDDYRESTGLTWNMNSVLLDRARKSWQRLGSPDHPTPLPANVKHFVIIGTGNESLVGYRLVPASDDDYVAFGAARVRGEPQWGDGDITVPVEMAKIKTATRTYFVRFKPGALGSKIGMVSTQHGDLPGNPIVQGLVWDAIEGKPNDGSFYGYAAPRESDSESVDFTLHSAAHLAITDGGNGGGHLGFNRRGGIDETLLTGSFVAIGKSEYASLRNISNKYHVTVTGTGEGHFTLLIDIGRGAKATRLSYRDVRVGKGTIAELDLSPKQAVSTPPPLKVKANGKTTAVAASVGAMPAATSPRSGTSSKTGGPASRAAGGADAGAWILKNDVALKGKNLSHHPRPAVEQCLGDCAANSHCNGFDWIKPGTAKATDPAMCDLLSVVTGDQSARGHISAVKFPTGSALARSAQIGRWELSAAESKVPAGAVKNHLVVVTPMGDKVRVTIEGTSPSGRPTHSEWTGQFDGRDYAVAGVTDMTRSYRQLDDHTLEVVDKTRGKTTASGKIVISADGKTRTATLRGVGPQPINSTSVYHQRGR